ncbi:MAG: hypothetical protein JXR95_02475 [Deltaproteobacteria bacterium]|nr:hypothetical protein [Deltaproteobacteria bacterium]
MYVICFFAIIINVFSGSNGNPWTEPLSHGDDPEIKKYVGNNPGQWSGKIDENLLANIRTAKIKSISFNKGGSTISLRLHFTNNTDAAFKPDQFHEQTVPRYEIAAYRINRLLGFSRVPPATHRTITKKELLAKLKDVSWPERVRILREVKFTENGLVHGEVSHWIPVIKSIPLENLSWRRKWMQWLAPFDYLLKDDYILSSQISDMVLFDFIINNPDRFTGFNTLASKSKKRLYFMDNTFSFLKSPKGHTTARIYMNLVRRFSQSTILKIKALTTEKIKKELAKEKNPPWTILTDDEIKMVIKRKEYLMHYIVKTIAQYGWSKTVVFP